MSLHSVPRKLAALVPVFLVAASVHAVTPSVAETELARQWVRAVVDPGQSLPRPSLSLSREDVADGVMRGRSWRGTPFQLGEKVYSHGLAFNSTKYFVVHLGQPGERFTAEVGLENNDDTRRGAAQGAGSVVFHVRVGGQEVFTSPVLRLADGAKVVDVALNGATEFELGVSDGGDGRGWDQALWAGATVRLRNGGELRLQDIPLGGGGTANPNLISFRYGGDASPALLPRWTREFARPRSGTGGGTLTWREPVTGLEVRLTLDTFADFPAVEWVAHFKNTGTVDTPMIENIEALDTTFPLTAGAGTLLHWARGGVASLDDFAPMETRLQPGKPLHLQPGGGRSSSEVLPFFNLEGAGGGVITAIGWTGEWSADFAATAQGEPVLKAGMARTHLVLHPGEEIRTPRMLLLFYQGDAWRGQNLFRRFILAQHRPQRNGQPMVAPITCGNWGGTSAEIHLDNIARIEREKLPIDDYWIDAEWYGQGGWPENVGHWEVKTNLYPHGFKPLSDALRRSGRELMLWFEPERVFRNTPWHRDHPGWLFNSGNDNSLFNLGLPEARTFLTDFISDRIDEFGLGCYRQDFNIDPLPFWQKADAPNRQGISEIRHIEGLYAFWDGLQQRHPSLIIDNCASGGRRLDLETLGRATPFWRTDGPRDPIAHQCHTYGLMAWVPLSATSQDRAGDDYEFRSSMCSSLCLNWWVAGDVPAERIPDTFPFAWARQTLAQYLQLRDFYYGDYYPLTGYSQARDVWMSYQLDRPERGDGLVVALRRPESPYATAQLVLHNLDAAATYRVRDLDAGSESVQSGRVLSTIGLAVAVPAKPGSALVLYRRQ